MTAKWPEIPIGPILEALGCENVPPEGPWRAVKCVNPSHDDSNASASTNGYGYKCHACGLKGNAVTIVKEVMNIERPGALRFIEDVFGGSLPEVSRKPIGRSRRIPFGSGEGSNRGDDKPIPVRVRKRPFAGS